MARRRDKDGRNGRLVSRRGVEHTKRFAELAAAISQLPAQTLILDGEVCAFDEALVSHMHLLMDPPADAIVTPPVLIAFDCLYSRGRDTSSWPLKEAFSRGTRGTATAHVRVPAGHGGADLLSVQKLGGWRTVAMVQRYAHLADHLRAAVDRLVPSESVESRPKVARPDADRSSVPLDVS